MELSVNAFFGKNKEEIIINPMNYNFVAAKVAQFSFSRLTGADPVLDVEMTSTGEVACFGEDEEEAFLKAQLSVGVNIPKKGIFISLGGDANKVEFISTIPFVLKLGIPVYATEKTSKFLRENGLPTKTFIRFTKRKTRMF